MTKHFWYFTNDKCKSNVMSFQDVRTAVVTGYGDGYLNDVEFVLILNVQYQSNNT